MDVEFPEKLQCLFQPKRYKIFWGGRGAGRSWNLARAMLLTGQSQAERNLCAREFQNSIADSVHKVLSDQIPRMELEDKYEIQKDRILLRPGVLGTGGETSFAFEGIKNNPQRIKSYEGINRCWVEEAVKVTKTSWETLIPTIRANGSEIWASFNPELETDYTYQRFVTNPPGDVIRRSEGFVETTDAFVIKLNWRDNPWFPPVLRREMEDLKARDYDAYLNVWEGHCRIALDGAIYAKELRRALEESRIVPKRDGGVRWDRQTPVDTFWDLGRADRTAIWFAQRVAMQYRILEYYENSGEDILHYLRECQKREYNYGTMWLPHDARAKRLGSRRTIEEIVRGHAGWNVRITPNLSVEDGINAARILFPNCWFDEDLCRDGLDRLRHYRYEVKEGPDGQKHRGDKPLHDEASDGADAFRYLAIAIRQSSRGNRPPLGERIRAAMEASVGQRRRDEESAGGRRSSGSSTGWMNL